MKTITDTITLALPAAAFPMDPERILFFDIETTGLSPRASSLYLIGTIHASGADQYTITQWFADTSASEQEMLTCFLEQLEHYDGLCHFNGRTFDIPYILNKCDKYHITPSSHCQDILSDTTQTRSFDMLLQLRPLKKLFGLAHGAQKDWEQFLGLNREDKYDGGQLIAVYKDYLMSKDEDLLHNLLLHNEDDLLGMKYLLPLFSYRQIFLEDITLQRIAPANKVFERGNGSIAISCRLPLPLPQPLEVSTPIGDLFSDKKDLSILTITLPFVEDVLKHFYKDYHNYYYLPKEERAIHKSVGCYVERQYRRAAKASTCYVKKEGIFLPLPKAQKHFGIQIENYPYEKTFPLYKREYKELRWFAEFDDVFSEKNTGISVYLRDIIKELLITRMECDL